MTHSPHTQGPEDAILFDGCERCAELARAPWEMDEFNRAMLMDLPRGRTDAEQVAIVSAHRAIDHAANMLGTNSGVLLDHYLGP